MTLIKKIILFLLIGLMIIRGYLFYTDWSHNKARQAAEEIFQETIYKKTNKASLEAVELKKAPLLPKNNAKIIGRIEIDALHLSYIILEGATEENLAISISKVTGPPIHSKGNLVLAGHNMRDGTLFGKLKHLKVSDSIRLQDLTGVSKEYIIYDKKIVKDTDLSPLNQFISESPIVTLITCTTQEDERAIFFAEQK